VPVQRAISLMSPDGGGLPGQQLARRTQPNRPMTNQ
jgi:hypothetical protein